MMQQQETARNLYKRFPFVDVIFGTHALYRFPELFYHMLRDGERAFDVEDQDGQISEYLPSKEPGGVSAFVTIMYGCNNYCTYCIVPFVRGRERSRRMEDIEMEVKRLVDQGVREITLLGQNVNSYGLDRSDDLRFADVLRRVNAIEGVERIRFMSSHPKDLSDELIRAMGECEHICSHFHLPVQSGSNAILKKMNRQYTREQYLQRVDALRKTVPDIELTTDIIVGFPGETENDFEDTLDIIQRVRYSTAFTFMYSPRSGTVAAKWPNQVEEAIKKERLLRLNAIQNIITKEENEKYMNTTHTVLIERIQDGVANGKTETFKTVYFPADDTLMGRLVDVRITGSKLNTLSGEWVRIIR
jgi:tRNA-N(6)-(isopentenyl)adenosine-37 thiotransferase enzyme MiaB